MCEPTASLREEKRLLFPVLANGNAVTFLEVLTLTSADPEASTFADANQAAVASA